MKKNGSDTEMVNFKIIHQKKCGNVSVNNRKNTYKNFNSHVVDQLGLNTYEIGLQIKTLKYGDGILKVALMKAFKLLIMVIFFF